MQITVENTERSRIISAYGLSIRYCYISFLLMGLLLLVACENKEISEDAQFFHSPEITKVKKTIEKTKRIIYFADLMSENEVDIDETYRTILEKKPTYLKYDLNLHGKIKSIHHHPLGEAKNTLTFNNISIKSFAKLKFSVGIFTEGRKDFSSDGVGFKVILWDDKKPNFLYDAEITEFDVWKDISIDLSEYKGKTVDISFKTEYLKNAQFDWATWGTPCITIHSIDKEHEVKKIGSADLHESLVGYYNNKKLTNGGEVRVDRGWVANAKTTDIILDDNKGKAIITRYEIAVLDKSDAKNEKVNIELLDQGNNIVAAQEHDVHHTKQIIMGEYNGNALADTPHILRIKLDIENSSIFFIKEPIQYSVPSDNHDNKKDNIILISLDTLRSDRLSCYGYIRDLSPNLDKIANESFVFTNAFSNSNWTLPAHTSLFISQYPAHHKIVINNIEQFDFYSDQWPYRYLTEEVKGQGYLTIAYTGGGYVNSRYGFNKGFDYHIEEVKELNEEIIDVLSYILAENKKSQLFLFFHTYEIHDYLMAKPIYFKYVKNKFHPYNGNNLVDILDFRDVPGMQFKKYDRLKESLLPPEGLEYVQNLYDGALSYTDEMLGKIFDHLKELNLYDTSWIIITSDHGEGLGDIHNNKKVKSFRHGPQLYDDQIKVPLIIKPPKGKVIKAKKIDTFVQLVDIAPTILEIMGSNKQPQFIGKNLLPIMYNDENENEAELFSENLNNQLSSITKDDYKLIMKPRSPYLLDAGKFKFELYDLAKDLEEKENLLVQEDSSKYAPIFNELKTALLQHLDGVFQSHHIDESLSGNEISAEDRQELDPKKLQRLKELGYL